MSMFWLPPTTSTTTYASGPLTLSPAAFARHSAFATDCPSACWSTTTRTECGRLPAASSTSPGLYSTAQYVAPPPLTSTGDRMIARMASGEPPPRPRCASWWRALSCESVSRERPSVTSSMFT